jgi:predicted nucleic acid-binding protein
LILDTNALSAFFKGDPDLNKFLSETGRQHLPTVVIGEYRFGLMRSRLRHHLQEQLSGLVSDSIVLTIDLTTTIHYARVRDELSRLGTPIPENDVWIAALARQHDLPVVTRDRHFERVPSVVRRGW